MIPQIRSHDFHPRFRLLSLWMLLLAGGAAALSPVQAHTYEGRAVAAYINAPSLAISPTYFADTGALAEVGGWESAGQLGVNIPGALSASVLNAATSGAEGQASSSASLADITVFPGSPAQLNASFAMAQSKAGTVAGATTEIYELTFGGLPVIITGLPNQIVELPGIATLAINEQTVSSDGTSASVNALRLTLLNGDEVIIAGARSTAEEPPLIRLVGFRNLSEAPASTIISPFRFAIPRDTDFRFSPVVPAQAKDCVDFVTGGGFFLPPNSSRPDRVNFGFNAGPRSVHNPQIKGHLNLVDHENGDHISGTAVDAYFVFGSDPEHCRNFEGDAKFNGTPGYRFEAFVCDYLEPGRDDRFQLFVFLGGTQVYYADNINPLKTPWRGDLDGGNTQLHKTRCPEPASTPSRQTTRSPSI